MHNLLTSISISHLQGDFDCIISTLLDHLFVKYVFGLFQCSLVVSVLLSLNPLA